MATSPLIGRDAHLRAITNAIRRSGDGTAQVLVVEGEAGSGKSALLAQAIADVPQDALLLRAAGHRAEQQLPYAGLHQMLSPVSHLLAELPGGPRDLLSRAIALDQGDPGAPLPIANALLQLVTTQSVRCPVVIVVDDVHWMDPSSRSALVFVARRLDADAVTMLLAVRSDDAEELREVGARLTAGPLEPAAARDFLRSRHPDLSAMVAASVVERAAGLPLALAEIPEELSQAQREGSEPLPLRMPAGRSLERLYSTRLAGIGPAAREALLLASFEDLEPDALVNVLAAADLGVVDLDPAERVRLVTVDHGRYRFIHPTLRSSIQASSTAAELQDAHRRLATHFTDEPARQAWHLHAASVGLNEEVAEALTMAAELAWHRGALVEAGRSWEAAASRTPDSDRRRDLSARAVEAYARAGIGPAALSLLDRLVEQSPGESGQAPWQLLRVTTSLWALGELPADVDALVELGLGMVGRDDERRAGSDLLIAVAGACLALGQYSRAKHLVDAVRAGLPGPLEPLGHALMCDVIDVTVGTPGAGATLRSDWVEQVPVEALADPSMPIGFVGMTLAWMGEVDACERIAVRCQEALGAITGDYVAVRLATGPMHAAVAEARGEWARALLEYASAESAAVDSDFTAPHPYVALRHAYVLAAQGRHDECQALRAEARRFTRQPTSSFEHLDLCVQGLLHLTGGDYALAAEALEKATEVDIRAGATIWGYDSGVVDHFEALWHLGRTAELPALAHRLDAAAAASGHATIKATAARCRALLAGPDDIDAAFAKAETLHRTAPAPFEAARTQLYWGKRLRRVRRKGDAQERLLTAHDIFTRLGAVGWLAQTASELAACGYRRAADPEARSGPLASLTPREFEVAQAVASGLSNVDAALRLFISQRTVEYHLSNVYRKVGIADRRSLTGLFGTGS